LNNNFKNKWYLLYVKPRHEKKVVKLLLENNIEAFSPMVNVVKQWSDRKKIVKQPLFPSYVFINVYNSSDFYKPLSIQGVYSFVRLGNERASVKESEINQIKLLIENEDLSDIESNDEVFKIGDKTKITHGLLNGLECQIINVNNQNKIIVRIYSLQKNITAVLPNHCLSKLYV